MTLALRRIAALPRSDMSEVDALVAMFGDEELGALWLVVLLAEMLVRRNRDRGCARDSSSENSEALN